LETARTLDSANASGTLVLRRSEIAKPISGSSVTGSCAVLDATGLYAGLAGDGKLTGVVELSASPPALTDTAAF
jgi:hypothetical protein